MNNCPTWHYIKLKACNLESNEKHERHTSVKMRFFSVRCTPKSRNRGLKVFIYAPQSDEYAGRISQGKIHHRRLRKRDKNKQKKTPKTLNSKTAPVVLLLSEIAEYRHLRLICRNISEGTWQHALVDDKSEGDDNIYRHRHPPVQQYVNFSVSKQRRHHLLFSAAGALLRIDLPWCWKTIGDVPFSLVKVIDTAG